MVFPIADGHCDYLYGMVHWQYEMRAQKREQVVSLPNMEAGHVALQLFACWTDMALRTPPLDQCLSMIDAYYRMLSLHPELTPLTKEFDPASGKIATLLTVEGGEAIDGSLAVLRTLYRLGVRAMTMTWNDNNELSGAAMARRQKGLTETGKDVIDEMCRIGMAIDVSHSSDKTIDDILERTTRPIFASHSNARAVHPSPRALSDRHIKEIANMGGVIGVNFYYQQLTAKPRATIQDIVRHMAHIAEVGGVEVCAIGSDFDGMQQYPADLKSGKDFPALTDALLKAGFSEQEVYRMAYQNLHDYLLQFV